MPSQPLVSIIIPTFNQGRFLERCLNSLWRQDYPNLEVIVVDGASRDNTVQILEKYSDRLRWISEPDDGEYFATNKGLAMARGKYVRYIPSDDLLAPGAVSLATDYLERHPGVAMVYSQFAYMDEDERLLGFACQREPFNLTGYLRDEFVPGSMTVQLRREVIEAVGPFDPAFAPPGDFEFFARVVCRGYQVVYLPHVLGGFRRYGEQQSARREEIMFRQILRIVKQYGTNRDLWHRRYSIWKCKVLRALAGWKHALVGQPAQAPGQSLKFDDLF